MSYPPKDRRAFMQAMAASAALQLAKRRGAMRAMLSLAWAPPLNAEANSSFGSGLALGYLTDSECRHFGSYLTPSPDLSPFVDMDDAGIIQHYWFGNAGRFRRFDRLSMHLARQCSGILGSSTGTIAFNELFKSFFGNHHLDREALIFIILNQGHVRGGRILRVHQFSAETSGKSLGDIGRKSELVVDKIRISPGYAPRKYDFIVPVPWTFMSTEHRDQSILITRRLETKINRPGRGTTQESTTQVGPALTDDRYDDPEACRAAGYFVNADSLRKPFDMNGYTDTTSMTAFRVVFFHGVPVIHSILLSFNAGKRRDEPFICDLRNNPDELLHIESKTQPYEYLKTVYPVVFGMAQARFGRTI